MTTPEAKKLVKVTMVADVVCPYCYIGLHRLQAAVEAAASQNLPVEVEIDYAPFILRRHLPKEGVEKLAMFKQQSGSDAKGRAVLQGIARNAAMDGLCFDLEGQRAGNSEDAHRLLLWARGLGKEMELFSAMVKAYNCEKGWLGNHEVLLHCTEKANLPLEEAKEVLQDGQRGLADLEQGLAESEQLGVSGVPFFLIDPVPKGARPIHSKFPMSGAVPAGEFLTVFKAIANDRHCSSAAADP